MTGIVRAESRDRARSTQIGIACELRWKPGGAVPELMMDGGPRIRAGLGDPVFSDLHRKAGWIVASAVDGAAVAIGYLPARLRHGRPGQSRPQRLNGNQP